MQDMCIMQTTHIHHTLPHPSHHAVSHIHPCMSLECTVLIHQAKQFAVTVIKEWEGTERCSVIECHINILNVLLCLEWVLDCHNKFPFISSEIELLHPLHFEQFAICEHILLQHPLIIQEVTIFGAQPESVVPTFPLPWSWICDLPPFCHHGGHIHIDGQWTQQMNWGPIPQIFFKAFVLEVQNWHAWIHKNFQ